MDILDYAEQIATKIAKTPLLEYNDGYSVVRSCFPDNESFRAYRRLDVNEEVMRMTNRLLCARGIPFMILATINQGGFRSIDIVCYGH